MKKPEEAKEILSAIGMPKAQANDRSALVLLALANVIEQAQWVNACRPELRIVDIMNFIAVNYNKEYKPNTRESIRKNTLHQFIDGAVVQKNIDSIDRPTNSPYYSYCLTEEMLLILQAYGTDSWESSLSSFTKEKGKLIQKYKQERELLRVPVLVDKYKYGLSAGIHNLLQKAIIEEFVPRFAKDAVVLYMGDTENKHLIFKIDALKDLGISITIHNKLPDIIMYSSDKEWIYFIEAVTSVGPISVKRLQEIKDLSSDASVGKIFITAFSDRKTYKRFVDTLAWDTEVWIADNPDHMIHLNGDRFIGPRS